MIDFHPLLAVYKENWNAGNSYIKGDWVRGSNDRLYEAIADGGEAEDPVTDTNFDYWKPTGDQAKDNGLVNGYPYIGYTGINEVIRRLNNIIGYLRNEPNRKNNI